MKHSSLPAALFLLLAVTPAFAQQVDPSTLTGKVLLGYQGWFRCPGGGTSGTNWSHWANGTPSAATLTIDMYPDLREFDSDELCAIPGMTIGARPATLFSSGNSKTVDRHFRWMRQYGLDGVLLQRFVTDIRGNRAGGDVVLKNVMAAAERHGRVFAIEYDISGANPATVVADLKADWEYLTGTHQVTSHPGYLRENGKPVVGVWGIGLSDNRHPPSDPDTALALIEWFRNDAKVSYMGGTPSYWRALTNDAAADPRWSGVYRAMDTIQPWTVGRYSNAAGADRWRTTQIQPDLAATEARNQLYMPVIFPGFSWYNLNRTSPQNQIPRNRGEFLWRQAWQARAAGARMLKIAMFDEVNEATAMFKLASRRSQAPDQGFWLTLDADGYVLPSDWYLRIAGEITRAFHGSAPMAEALPEKPGPPWRDAGISVANAASFQTGSLAPEALGTAVGAGLPTAVESLTVIDASGAAFEAALLFVSPSQVNFRVPERVAPGVATIVATGGGAIGYGEVSIGAVAPGIFASGVLVRTVQTDGTQTVSALAEEVPIDLSGGQQVVLELYSTGVRGRSSVDAVKCSIGGTGVPVLYAGPQGFPGLDQINVSLPPTLAGSGRVSLVCSVDGVAANAVAMWIR